MPLGVEDAFSGLCEASQVTMDETLIRESHDVFAAKMVCVDSREILHTCEGAHERVYNIDAGVCFFQKSA